MSTPQTQAHEGTAARAAERLEIGFGAPEPPGTAQQGDAPRSVEPPGFTPSSADSSGEDRRADEPAPYAYPAGSSGDQQIEELTRAALSEVFDPEIGIDIVSLGLIYGAALDPEGLLTIDMTLTSPYCPMGGLIQSQAHAVCRDLPGVADVHVNLVWTPPWDPRVMASDEARLELGIY